MAERAVSIKVILSVEGKKGLQDVESLFKKLGANVQVFVEKSKTGFKSVSHDVDILAKTARRFSEAWEIPFTKAYNQVRKFGV